MLDIEGDDLTEAWDLYLQRLDGSREQLLQRSVIAPIARGHIVSVGWCSYLLALEALIELIRVDRAKEV